MGFTPEYVETVASWNSEIVFPYVLDQEFASNPKTRAYFTLFVRIIVAATGVKPFATHVGILSSRIKPLFQSLKDQPAATFQQVQPVSAAKAGNKAAGVLTLSNGSQYARLVRMRAEWSGPKEKAPYLVIYGDSYFDLMPREVREIPLEFVLPESSDGSVRGRLVIEGSNLAAVEVPVTFRS